MKLNYPLLVFIVSAQMFFSSAALAWSPLDGFNSTVESIQQCYSVVASSGDDEQKDNKKEEEEPDCD